MCWHKRHSPVAVHKIKVIDSLTFIIFHEAEYLVEENKKMPNTLRTNPLGPLL